LKLRYVYAAVAVALLGILISLQVPLFSQVFLRRTDVIDIPRMDFRLNIVRVWEDDVVRIEMEVEGEEDDLLVTVERAHFWVGARQEGGTPASIFTRKFFGPSTVEGSEDFLFEVDVEGHLNIYLDNTDSSYPKTVRLTTVFEKSTNVKYATLIIRNLSLLGSGILLLFGWVDNYEEIMARLGKG
jgi:hypothetical protein